MLKFIKDKVQLLNTPQWKHLYMLLYWIVYLAIFQLIEHINFPHYHILHSGLDDYIPFCEYFVVPYIYWFVYMGSMAVYTMLYDRDAFVYFMKMVIVTSLTACAVYCIYPNGLQLRPETFERNNIFTRLVAMIYSFDTSTNVCPSLHVSGSVLTMLTWRRCAKLNKKGHKIYHIAVTVLICMSTVFMKQHSVIDVFWGLVLALTADFVVCYKAVVARVQSYFASVKDAVSHN